MKKILILFALCTLFTGCQKTNQDNTNKDSTTGNSKTNEVLCSITSTISKYEINLDNEGYKNMAATLTKDKLIENYKEDEMYTCTTN